MPTSEFDSNEKRWGIRNNFPRGSTFVYPECGQTGLIAYDTAENIWRHPGMNKQPEPGGQKAKVQDYPTKWNIITYDLSYRRQT